MLEAAHHVEAVAAGQDPQLLPFPAQHRPLCNQGLQSQLDGGILLQHTQCPRASSKETWQPQLWRQPQLWKQPKALS